MERNENQTSIEKIKEKLKNLNESESKKKKAILISTGSFNPIQIAHIEMFNQAKTQLESKNDFIILCCFISPSHDCYVEAKLGKKNLIPSKIKIQLIKKAIKEVGYENFLEVDSWESECYGFVNFPSVTISMSLFIEKKFPNEKIKTLYLCGLDHLNNCGGISSLRNGKINTGVAVFERFGTKKYFDEKKEKNLYYIKSSFNSEISSTLLRKYVKEKKREKILSLSFKCIADYYLGEQIEKNEKIENDEKNEKNKNDEKNEIKEKFS